MKIAVLTVAFLALAVFASNSQGKIFFGFFGLDFGRDLGDFLGIDIDNIRL